MDSTRSLGLYSKYLQMIDTKPEYMIGLCIIKISKFEAKITRYIDA